MRTKSSNHYRWQVLRFALLSLLTLTVALSAFAQSAQEENPQRVKYNTVKVDGLDIFYREAGDKQLPTVLLLHGFPTSSHMFRNLIPALSDKYHVVAPDYPGFGQSSMPKVNEFDYTFDRLAEVVDKFTRNSVSRHTAFMCRITVRRLAIGWRANTPNASRR